MTTENIHATCIASPELKNGSRIGVLLTGPSASGKSDLGLRLIMEHGFSLIADDRTDITSNDGALIASCPAAIRGKIEVRGLGLLTLETIESAPVHLIIELVERKKVPRIPPEDIYETLCGVAVIKRHLHAFDASTPAKLALFVDMLASG